MFIGLYEIFIFALNLFIFAGLPKCQVASEILVLVRAGVSC